MSTTDQKALHVCGFKGGFQIQVYWLISTWWLGCILALKQGSLQTPTLLDIAPPRCHWLCPSLLRLLLETVPKPMSTDPQRILPWLGRGLCNTPPPIIGSHYSILINLSVQSSGSVTEWGRKKLAKRKPLFPGEVPPLLDTQAQGQMFFLRAVSPRRKFQNTIPGSGD